MNQHGFGDDGDDFENSPEAQEEALANLEKKKASDEFAKMLEDSFKGGGKKRLAVGDKIRGEILVIGKEEVYVSTGTMNDGVVSRRDADSRTRAASAL